MHSDHFPLLYSYQIPPTVSPDSLLLCLPSEKYRTPRVHNKMQEDKAKVLTPKLPGQSTPT